MNDVQKIELLRRALEVFANCELTDDNCASMAVATKRIRAMARRALKDTQ